MTRALWHDVRDALAEQVTYRELLWQMTKRDLLLRYKQTVMGVAWAVFMPLTNTAVFSVIFTRVAPIALEVPYPLFAYVGAFGSIDVPKNAGILGCTIVPTSSMST